MEAVALRAPAHARARRRALLHAAQDRDGALAGGLARRRVHDADDEMTAGWPRANNRVIALKARKITVATRIQAPMPIASNALVCAPIPVIAWPNSPIA